MLSKEEMEQVAERLGGSTCPFNDDEPCELAVDYMGDLYCVALVVSATEGSPQEVIELTGCPRGGCQGPE